MRTSKNPERAKFFVDFGPVAIEGAVRQELEGKIQQLALGVLAKTDYKGDISLGGLLPPDLYGLTLGDGDDDGDGDGEENGTGGADAVRSLSRAKTAAPRGAKIRARRKTVTFPCRLASSKAAAVSAIRVSHIKHDIHYEQLDNHNQPIVGFVLHPVVDKRNKLVAVTIARMGLPSTGETTLGGADRSALASIVDELSQFQQSSSTGGGAATGGGPVMALSWAGVIGTGISCGLAAIESGGDLLEDGACAAGIVAVLEDDDDDDDGDDDD